MYIVNQFEECKKMVDKIRRKRELIAEINDKLYSPKNQIVSDMPRGGATENIIDKYLEKKQCEEEAIKELQKQLTEKWNGIETRLKEKGTNQENIILMYERFICSKSWQSCVDYMKERYPSGNWNANKAFRTYRSNLYKLNK